ncbi:MAG TPA: hypothetical protein VFJ99_04155 [Solirubrobacterales bacterium]|nr:hypothetical protein [Solirubrobacterales bacterium]
MGTDGGVILPRVNRRWGLIASGLATLLLLWAMSPTQDRMEENGPGIVSFELSGGQDRADEILAEWGEDGRDAAREQLWIDYGFMLAYGTLLGLAGAAVRDLCRRRDLPRLARAGNVALWLGPLAAGFDALENACLLLTLGGAGAAFPLLATIFAATKFLLLALAIAYLIAGLAGSLGSRLRTAST